MASYAYPGPVDRVECGGGPLVVVPVEVLTRWEGVGSEGPESDYDRACAVVGRTGLLTVGPSHALVRGDGPSSTTFLPKQGVFVRWVAAESEVELLGGVEAAWEDVAWEDGQVWEVPGAGRALRLRLARPEVEPDNHTRGAAASGPDRGDHRARLRTLAAANGPPAGPGECSPRRASGAARPGCGRRARHGRAARAFLPPADPLPGCGPAYVAP
ncbi:Imm21 family immunity protein [Streptomyces virginiae]|uniref:Imm21 family immunity protein n=1 Tax=Streptomyces virginiae TaxID=1961 RepID=UPI003862D681